MALSAKRQETCAARSLKHGKFGRYTTRSMHQEVAMLHGHGLLVGRKIRHRNGNGLDNRYCNLEVCTPYEEGQMANHGRRDPNVPTGIYWHKPSNRWRLRMCHEGKHMERSFESLDQAIAMRRKWAKDFKQVTPALVNHNEGC